jgi:PleD family two-component response regulator
MRKLKVLLADDSEALLSALRIQLEAQGMEVATCVDAYMALAAVQKYKPDVMVLDIRMPAGEGFSVQERMANIPEVRGIPVIYITGDKSMRLGLKADNS